MTHKHARHTCCSPTSLSLPFRPPSTSLYLPTLKQTNGSAPQHTPLFPDLSLRAMAAQEAQMVHMMPPRQQQQQGGGGMDMWGLPDLDGDGDDGGYYSNNSSSSSSRSARSPQQIWSSLSARDKRDLTRKVMSRRTPSQAQVSERVSE